MDASEHTGSLSAPIQAGTGQTCASQGYREFNIPVPAKLVDESRDFSALTPFCALIFKQELPPMFPHDAVVTKAREACFAPFEYLM